MYYAKIDYGSTKGFMIGSSVESLVEDIEKMVDPLDYTLSEKDGKVKLSGYMFLCIIDKLELGKYVVTGSTNQW